jgi:hypothetical protein
MEIVPLVMFSNPASSAGSSISRSRWVPHQHHELSVPDIQIDVLDRGKRRVAMLIEASSYVFTRFLM